MYRSLYLCFIIILCNVVLHAQGNNILNTRQGNVYEYYIRISGVNTRQNVEDLQNIISKKPGVSFFMANRYPVRYFFLKCDHAITKKEFEHFLNNSSNRVEFYGEGQKGREQAILLYNNLKAQER